MAANSILTNNSAFIALQNLNATNRELGEVQSRVNTGKKVAGPKDNGAIFAIAQNMRSKVNGLTQVQTNLSNAISAVDVAVSAGQSVSDLLNLMKEKAVLAEGGGLDTAARNSLNEDFKALRDQITNVVDNAEFNGTNLVKGGSDLKALANDKGNTITVSAVDLTVSTLGISSSTITTSSNAATARAAIEAAIKTVNNQVAKLGTAAKKLDIHNIFVGQLMDSLNAGIGNLVDADLAKESARLQSLQIRQQLGIQALGIANSAPQNLLGLFR